MHIRQGEMKNMTDASTNEALHELNYPALLKLLRSSGIKHIGLSPMLVCWWRLPSSDATKSTKTQTESEAEAGVVKGVIVPDSRTVRCRILSEALVHRILDPAGYRGSEERLQNYRLLTGIS